MIEHDGQPEHAIAVTSVSVGSACLVPVMPAWEEPLRQDLMGHTARWTGF